jgi:hypothetical protein
MKIAMVRWLVAGGAWLAVAAFGAGVSASGGAVSVSDVKAEWKKKFGADKDKEWLKVSFTATVVEKVDKFVYPKLKVSCGDAADEVTSMTTKFHELEVGKSAAHDAFVFYDKGEALSARPPSCSVKFGYGKSTKKDDFTAISDYCISGTSVSDGACK